MRTQNVKRKVVQNIIMIKHASSQIKQQMNCDKLLKECILKMQRRQKAKMMQRRC